MAEQRPGGFPLRVCGDWGPAEPPPGLRKKLLCYFQSQKRSGGGECELRAGTDPGTGTRHLLVCFARPEVKQRVLQRQRHELHLQGNEKLKLIVTEPETALAAEEIFEEKGVSTKAPDVVSNLQTKGIFVPNSGLREEAGSAETSPSVVFENIQKCSPSCLRLLLENISGLTVDDDFTVEVIPEINVAVATFKKSIDTKEFVKKCLQHKRVREFKMTARLLELTQTIRAESLPDNICTDYITVYFESARNGGGPVSDVQLFPEENSAIITFCNHKDLTAVLERQHFLEQTLISVHPYYHSLGTVLYGGKRPTIKMPDPTRVPLDPYVWQFLQRHDELMQGINQEMAVCHCELKWPQAGCANPEVMLCPASSLSEQKKAMIKLIKTWKQDASNEFSRIMARYISIKCKVKSADWEDVKNRLLKDVSLTITDISGDMVAIAGSRAAVDSAEKEVRECMEKAMKQSKREKQSIEISVPVIPGKYAVLRNAGLEENIHREYPCLKIFYDDKKKTLQLCGLPAEVYKIKADLLEKVLGMAHTSVAIDPHVFHYLQCVDNKKISDTLFIQKKIDTFYELEEDTVLLYGDAPKDLSEAEKQIKTSLEYKCINVEDSEIIKKEQWKKLLVFLQKTHSSFQQTVITEQSVGKENKVIIAGFSKAVAEVYQKLNDFIDKNTLVEKIIPANSVVVVEFIEKEKSGIYHKLRKKDVTVCFDIKTPGISVRGPRAEIPDAVNMFEKLVSSLYSKNVLVDKPGAKEFFIERKDSCVFEAKQKFGCFIRVKEEEEKQQQKGEKVGHKVKRKLYYEKRLPHGVVVAVYKGDLCDYPVDGVVNASNEDLKHIGGLAEALLRAAGPTLQEECDELVRKNGRFQPGSAVITGAGKLPCKQVIHAVGPRWRKAEPEKCIWLLKKAVKKSLELAETYNHRSVALPFISGGISGFPLQICVDSIVSSIKETLEGSMGDSSLKEVHLVDMAEETVQALSETVKEVFSGKSSSPTLQTPGIGSSKLRKRQEKAEEHLTMVTTNEGLCILVEEKNVQEAMTDVVVNSVGEDLQFGVGPLCKALLETAGPALQAEFDKQSQASGPGSVVCTSGHALACKSVFHAILPGWNGGQTQKVLEDVIKSCLKKTEELGLKSISFPAIGTGGFGFPKTVVSKLMFDVVFEFSSSHTLKNLQEVHFILNPKDTGNIQAFNTELQCRVAESGHAAAPQSSLGGPVSPEELGVHEMKIGSITLQLISGDITKEDTEVIVNISNSSFDATTGVFKAIMDAAGSQVVDECAQYAGQFQSGILITQGGNLLCSKIIHLISNNQVKSQVSTVLDECEKIMYKSVAFPAIGTGQARQSPAKVADEMMDAIVEFAHKKSVQHLQTIKIVIFQKNMFQDFYESMKKRQDSDLSTTDSWFSMIKSFFWGKNQSPEKKKAITLEKKVYLVTFQICGESQENVDAAESWIKNLILKEQYDTTITNELIESFGERQIAALADLQRRKLVTIELAPPQVTISGISRDVCFVSVEVQTMIQKMKDAEDEQSKAEVLYNLVEWRYLGSNDTFVAFDKLTNMQLEDAKIAKKPYLNVKINTKNYQVDLNTLQARDDQGKTINIQRVPKNEELPKEWEDMQNEEVKLVNLKPSHPEYVAVEKRFKKTCTNFNIEKIKRVQNPFLWQTYQLKKKSLCKKNKSENNEKLLFHGTAASSLRKINCYGFNRGFAGKNAAAIGNGTYFAAHASYSAQDTYSIPDDNGKKHMYLARVLTGQYCAGKPGLVTPPPKNPADPTDLYDSVVDNVSNPTMFVIFNDIQAYPEYLITFK